MRTWSHLLKSTLLGVGALLLFLLPQQTEAATCQEARSEQEAYCSLIQAYTTEYTACITQTQSRYAICLGSDDQIGSTATQAQRDQCDASRGTFTTACYVRAEEEAPIVAGCNALDPNFPEDQCSLDAIQIVKDACDKNALVGYVNCVTRQIAPEAPATPPPGAANGAAQGPAQTGPVSESYNQILEHGIIFANICANTAESPCPCRDDGDCTVQDILQFVVNIMNFILAISGTLVLLMFLYGGFTWLTSAGNSDAVSRGKGAMTAAVVGLVIIFSSYAIIVFVVTVLTDEELGQSSLEDLVDGEDIFQTQ